MNGLSKFLVDSILGESNQPTFTMYSGITGDAWKKIWKNKNFIDKVTNVTNDEDFALDYSYNFKTGEYEEKYVEISNIPLDAFVSVRDRDYEDDDDFESLEDLPDDKKITAIKLNDLFLVNLLPFKNQIKTRLIESVETMNEAMVQVAGNKKPAGAKVLATIIIDKLDKEGYLRHMNRNESDIAQKSIEQLIIDSTF